MATRETIIRSRYYSKAELYAILTPDVVSTAVVDSWFTHALAASSEHAVAYPVGNGVPYVLGMDVLRWVAVAQGNESATYRAQPGKL
jgi:hypothetical protein